jgi:NADPH:quinone reductase
MKAWLLDRFGGVAALRLAEVPDPTPQAGEAVLEIHYAALNPADRYLAEKLYPAKPALPHILGRDGMGTVLAVGPGVDSVAVGERRLILRGDAGVERPGTFAERVAVPVQCLAEIPPGWDEKQAASATLVYLTAYQALTAWGPLPSGRVVLVTGASGGVGVASIQLALALGHTVVALSRSEDKRRRLTELGATLCLDPTESSWRLALKKALAPRRVELAIDNVGGALFSEIIDTLGDDGKVSVVGRLAGPVPNFNTATLFFRRLRVGGIAVTAYAPTESRAAWQEVVGLLARTGARPVIDNVLPFDKLPEAFERLSAGPMGKVLLAAPGRAVAWLGGGAASPREAGPSPRPAKRGEVAERSEAGEGILSSHRRPCSPPHRRAPLGCLSPLRGARRKWGGSGEPGVCFDCLCLVDSLAPRWNRARLDRTWVRSPSCS